MLSGTVESECRQPQLLILADNRGAVVGADATAAAPAAMPTSADDAPDRQATKALSHATIQPAVIGAATTGRELANPIAVN
jgi:hypothetical protein